MRLSIIQITRMMLEDLGVSERKAMNVTEIIIMILVRCGV